MLIRKRSIVGTKKAAKIISPLFHDPQKMTQFSLTHHSAFRFDERPARPIHLVIESAGVAEVVSVAVTPP